MDETYVYGRNLRQGDQIWTDKSPTWHTIIDAYISPGANAGYINLTFKDGGMIVPLDELQRVKLSGPLHHVTVSVDNARTVFSVKSKKN